MTVREWKILGRIIGTATGWDQGDTFAMNLYNFIPADGIALPPGEPFIDFETGKVEYFDSEGNITQSFDIVKILASVERAP
jgi:hypothetical protein